MKKMIQMAMMAAAMFMIGTTVAQAQGRGRGPNIVAILKDSLKVTDAILAKADSIQKAGQAEMAPLMEAARGGDADARTKLTAARQKQNDAIRSLLSDDQKVALDKIMAAMPQGRRGGPPPTR